jgi:hypothetical protein
VGGEIQRTTAGAAASLVVAVSDTDYNQPGGSSRTLFSSASDTFTNVAKGDGLTFTSWFNPSNNPFGKDDSSGSLTLDSSGPRINSHSGDTPGASVGINIPYGLTNETVITLSGVSAGSLPDVVFGGSTQILDLPPAPEPASIVLMLMAVPLIAFGARRRRTGP